MPVDYKGDGRSNLIILGVSSHHRCGFFFFQKHFPATLLSLLKQASGREKSEMIVKPIGIAIKVTAGFVAPGIGCLLAPQRLIFTVVGLQYGILVR